jgi:hypothetical protein
MTRILQRALVATVAALATAASLPGLAAPPPPAAAGRPLPTVRDARAALDAHASTFVEAPAGAVRYWSADRAFPAGFAPTEILLPPPAGRPGEGLRLALVGADPAAGPVAAEPIATSVSHFEGPKERWRTGLRTYGAMHYRDLWPGVDATFRVRNGRLKYEFVVRPGADPSRIRLAYRGARHVSVLPDAVEAETAAGTLRDGAPISYQERDGRRLSIETAYEAKGAPDEFGFRVGAYDRSRPLVVDPDVVYAGFVGGSSTDTILDMAVDAAGAVYVVGTTTSRPSEAFPVVGGPDATFNPFDGSGLPDAFVAKLRPDGSGLEYCGYIGGILMQYATGVAVDGAGNAYVAGVTMSDEMFFPVTVGPDRTFNSGRSELDAFIAKVSADGSDLLYCGYIGGNATDDATDVAVDAAGNAYVAGTTYSNGGFPAAGRSGSCDAYVVKVRADGTGFAYGRLVGGSGEENGLGVAVDGAGSAYLAGATSTSQATFPATVGPDLTYAGGSYDGFVAKLRPDGSGLVYCGFVGGAGDDTATRVAVDSTGAAYVVGSTSSSSEFPLSVGPDLTFNGGADAFVAKVRPDGTGFAFCGYIGGANGDAATAVAVDGAGAAYVAGTTLSTEVSFPVSGGPDGTFNGGLETGDAFVAKVRPDGSGLAFATYVGGSGDDAPAAIALDGAGFVYVAGLTATLDDSFPSVRSRPKAGGTEGFVVKLSQGPPGPLVTSVAKVGKKLVVTGENFAARAVIQVDGTGYKTKADPATPSMKLNSKKAGKVVAAGDAVTVRNPDGSVSNAVVFSP